MCNAHDGSDSFVVTLSGHLADRLKKDLFGLDINTEKNGKLCIVSKQMVLVLSLIIGTLYSQCQSDKSVWMIVGQSGTKCAENQSVFGDISLSGHRNACTGIMTA